jgi:hypothetical protein
MLTVPLADKRKRCAWPLRGDVLEVQGRTGLVLLGARFGWLYYCRRLRLQELTSSYEVTPIA